MIVAFLVKRAVNDLSFDATLHVGHFFGALVDQKHHQLHFGRIDGDRMRDHFQKGGFTCFRRRNDHSALSLSDRRDQVDCSCRKFVSNVRDLQTKFLIRKDRHEVVEFRTLERIFHFHSVDLGDRDHCGRLPFRGRFAIRFDHIARAQTAFFDSERADVTVTGAVSEIIRA